MAGGISNRMAGIQVGQGYPVPSRAARSATPARTGHTSRRRLPSGPAAMTWLRHCAGSPQPADHRPVRAPVTGASTWPAWPGDDSRAAPSPARPSPDRPSRYTTIAPLAASGPSRTGLGGICTSHPDRHRLGATSCTPGDASCRPVRLDRPHRRMRPL
jgi:hypothetical protein